MKKIVVLLLGLMVLLLASGCSRAAKPAAKTRAQITFVNTDHEMEHIIFSGGYLRTEPELIAGNIICSLIKGSQGILYGKRRISNKEWAKVTTREGLTGWYSPADGLAKDASPYLQLRQGNFQRSYPQISGINQQAAQLINAEIANYLEVFKLVVGPVGSNLQCRITYNQHNILSILFSVPKINYRTYDIGLTQNKPRWAKLNKYCSISPLHILAASSGLTAEVSDLQYAMTFDLQTGKRLDLAYFLEDNLGKVQPFLGAQGEDLSLQKDNFYVEGANELIGLAEVGRADWGRKKVELSNLVKRKYNIKD